MLTTCACIIKHFISLFDDKFSRHLVCQAELDDIAREDSTDAGGGSGQQQVSFFEGHKLRGVFDERWHIENHHARSATLLVHSVDFTEELFVVWIWNLKLFFSYKTISPIPWIFL